MLISHDGETEEDPPSVHTANNHGVPTLVKFMPHACRRVMQRGVGIDIILSCLERPDERNLEVDISLRPRKRVRRHLESNRSLDVVYELEANGSILVVTTFFVSGSRR